MSYAMPLPGVPLYVHESPRKLYRNPSIFRKMLNHIQSFWFQYTLPVRRFYTTQILCIFCCHDPLPTLLSLLNPTPWKFSIPPLLSITQLQTSPELFDNSSSIDQAYAPITRSKLFQWRDTSLRSLCRLYALIIIGDQSGIVQESQYFFHTQSSWRLIDIPDPKDSDPVRYAVLASVVDALVSSFNWKISIGLRRGITVHKPWLIAEFQKDESPPFESPPPWCGRIGPLSETLSLIPGWKGTLHPEEDAEKYSKRKQNVFGPFVKRNIMAEAIQLWNV